jgi:hypothetical protein
MAYRDITDEFTDAASSLCPASIFIYDVEVLFQLRSFLIFFLIELRTGQLVKDESFTLFEAVGALEVRSRQLR